MDDGNGQREPLPDAERDVRCKLIDVRGKSEALYQIGDPVISGGAGWEARLDMAPGDRSLTAPAGGAAQGTIRVALRFAGAFNAAAPTTFDRTLSVSYTHLTLPTNREV